MISNIKVNINTTMESTVVFTQSTVNSGLIEVSLLKQIRKVIRKILVPIDSHITPFNGIIF